MTRRLCFVLQVMRAMPVVAIARAGRARVTLTTPVTMPAGEYCSVVCTCTPLRAETCQLYAVLLIPQ